MTRSECSGVKSKVGCWNSLNKSGRKRRWVRGKVYW